MNTNNKADKVRKKLIREELKRIQPRACQKFIKIVVDDQFSQTSVGKDLLLRFESAQFKYELRNLSGKACIFWERSINEPQLVGDGNKSTHQETNPPDLIEKWQTENQLIRIFERKELDQSLLSNSLNTTIELLKLKFPDMHITLIFPALAEKSSNNAQLEREMLVTELQISQQCNILQLRTQTELFELLKRFTKAVAEAPYKKQKSQIQAGFEKFLLNDNKQCVRVEGSHGLGRLWQQHLDRLPLLTFDIAEAIRAEYSCPRKIIKDIQQKSDILSKLSNIQLNRRGEEFGVKRRIGNAMSNKLIKLYQTKNPYDLI